MFVLSEGEGRGCFDYLTAAGTPRGRHEISITQDHVINILFRKTERHSQR